MAGSNIARVYAASLLDAARNNVEDVHEELSFVASLFEEDEDFKSYMTSPRFSKDDKKNFVKKVFSDHLSETIVNFINVLIENGRQTELPEINTAFDDLADELNNRMKVSVVSVSKLDDGTLQDIKAVLKRKFGKDVSIKEETDASILGGIIIKAGDLVIDGSLAFNLKKIKSSLLTGRIRSEVAYED